MRKSFEWITSGVKGARHGARFWLQTAAIALAVLNAAALFFYIDPPGGSRKQLLAQQSEMHEQTIVARAKALRLKRVSEKVQLGSTQSSSFESKYFLPKRAAYQDVIGEIQRMGSASGLQEREAAFTEEPIDGAPDLELLNVVAAFQGTYDNLMHFFLEADHSPMLLMIDAVQAAPQQRSAQINTTIRFQIILHEDGGGLP
jgi:Tfp pilus assembly protein PilO